MLLLGAFGAVAQVYQIKALHAARAATVVPILYANLWATFFGFILFAELPGPWTVLGGLVISASGLYIFHREQKSRDSVSR